MGKTQKDDTQAATLRIPKALWRRLRHMALDQGTTANAAIVKLVEKALPKERK
jgi:macrodomain Ter protein organizer (MatP/YcbG family)